MFLSLALTFGLIKAFCGKKSSSSTANCYEGVVISCVRMLFCALIGLVLVLIDGASLAGFATPKVILIALLCGVSTACFTVSWLLSVRTAYMMTEVFVMVGTVIPFTLCSVIYKEIPKPMQIIGILLLFIAVWCMCTYKKQGKSRISLGNIIPLVCCSLSSGVSDFSQMLYVREVENANVSLFNFYTFLFAAAFLTVAGLVFGIKEKKNPTAKSPSP